MTDLQYSPLMQELIELSKTIGEKKSPPFTAERFFVTLVSVLEGSMSIQNVDDFRYVADPLIKSNLDLAKLKEVMLEDVLNDKNELMEDVFMRNSISAAIIYSTKSGFKELTPAVLVYCILSSPCAKLKLLLSRCIKETNQTQTEASPEDRPIVPKSNTAAQNGEPEARPMNPTVDSIPDPTPQKNEKPVNHGDNAMPKAAISKLTEKVKKIQEVLSSKILGQANAINITTSGYFQAELLAMTATERTKPKSTFLFAGPPGVGKTLLAESFAQETKLPYKRFDMSEYSDKEAHIRLIGSDQVYKDSQSGALTKYVSENPKCVILFDEIEKAHAVVHYLLYQVLDAGTLVDAKTNKTVSFKDVYLIFTTNAGKQYYEDTENGDFSSVSRKVILKAIQKDVNPATNEPFFPAALCSRFAQGNVVMFNHMFAHILHDIAKAQITKHCKTFGEKFGIKTDIEESVYTALLFSEGGNADARTVSGRAKAFFDNELYELLRLTSSKLADSDIKDIDTISIGVSLPENNPDICKLFRPTNTPELLLFSAKEIAEKYVGQTDKCIFRHCENAESAKACLKNHDIKAIIIDINYGKKHDADYLNIEDEASDARDFFYYAHESHNSVPIYFIETAERDFDPEEIISFMRKGVKGIVDGSLKKGVFAEQIESLCLKIYQQQSMNDLARANKLVTYETAQKLSEDGKHATISLFDFKLAVALDPEDSDEILGNMSKPNVSFDDVIGAAEAQSELKYFVDYLKDPKKYLGTGVSVPKGVLLYGPPGTGKTLLAKAMASASDSTFINVEGNKLMSNGQGDGSERIHKLFRTARKYAPTIIFIDEIDAIAKERTGYGGGSEAVLTALLTEMDGFKKDATRPVFVLAATNFDVTPGSPKSLDGALMRRFDRKLYIGLPGKADRKRYIQMKASKNPRFELSKETIDSIATRSVGMSLALLENVIELALRTTLIKGLEKVTDEIFEEAFESFNSGERRQWDPSELMRTARHEAGHAFLCYHGGETPSYLTIVARGNHGGYMQHGDNENKGTYTKKDLINRIRVSLAGRAAEIVYYGAEDGITTGASGDLESATRVAQAMICTYGMDDPFGLSVIGHEAAVNGELSAEVRARVNTLLSEEMKNVIEIINQNKSAIDALVEKLMQNSYMTGDDIEKTLSQF